MECSKNYKINIEGHPLTPFYFKNSYLFIISWIAMATSLSIGVSHSTHEADFLFYLLLTLSLISFAFGYLLWGLTHPSYKTHALSHLFIQSESTDKKLYRILLTLFTISIPLMAFNYITDGPPPIFGFFGHETKNYLEYGRFLAPIIAISGIIIMMSALFKKKYLTLFFLSLGAIVIVLHVQRGPLLFHMLQFIVLYTTIQNMASNQLGKTTRIRLVTQLIVIASLAIGAGWLMGYIGNLRSGMDSFVEFLNIKQEFVDTMNPGLLWVITYISTPISNFLHFTSSSPFGGDISLHFISRTLPSFLWATDGILEKTIEQNANIIDGVHSYLFYWYSGLGLAGLIMINAIYGWFSKGSQNNIFLSPIFASIMIFSFFIDYLFYFPTLLQITLTMLIARSLTNHSERTRINIHEHLKESDQ